MSETTPDGRKVGTYTVAALLGLFVAAALLALYRQLIETIKRLEEIEKSGSRPA